MEKSDTDEKPYWGEYEDDDLYNAAKADYEKALDAHKPQLWEAVLEKIELVHKIFRGDPKRKPEIIKHYALMYDIKLETEKEVEEYEH